MFKSSSLLVTGGAGFVGSRICCALAAEGLQVTAVDSLKRRGSELNVERLARYGVSLIHADLRCAEDLEGLPDFDVLIDCAAEPSVHAGQAEGPRGVVNANFSTTLNSLELVRRVDAAILLLSTSRVYSIPDMLQIPLAEQETRFAIRQDAILPAGLTMAGLTEGFPLAGARSFYGFTKLASELLIQEYVFSYGIRALIDRCGVIAGPGQMGRVDQGVVALWVAAHLFGQPLSYIGYGGSGKQVRDVLHVDDLVDLVKLQLTRSECWDGRIYNAGGGLSNSVSLCELTELCQRLVGRVVPIGCIADTSRVDVPLFIADCSRARHEFDWLPQRGIDQVVRDTLAWLEQDADRLRPLFVRPTTST